MVVKITKNDVQTFHGRRQAGQTLDLPVHEAIKLIKEGSASAEGPRQEPDDSLPFARMNSMMKPPMTS